MTNGAPNILFVIDNSANWARDAQKWPAPSDTQGEGELLAIQTLLANLKKPLNVGVMMLTNKNEIGGFVRFGVRPMLDLNGTPNDDSDDTPTDANDKLRTMLAAIQAKVNDPTEQVPQAQDGYASALYEAWLYFKGQNSWAGMDIKADFPGNNTAATAAKVGLTTGHRVCERQRQGEVQPTVRRRSLHHVLHRLHRQQPRPGWRRSDAMPLRAAGKEKPDPAAGDHHAGHV